MDCRGLFCPINNSEANSSHQGIAVFLCFNSHRTEGHRGVCDFQVTEGDAQIHAVLLHQPLFQKTLFLAVQFNLVAAVTEIPRLVVHRRRGDPGGFKLGVGLVTDL